MTGHFVHHTASFRMKHSSPSLYPRGDGDISAFVNEVAGNEASYSAEDGYALIPFTIMTLIEDRRAPASPAITVSHRRQFLFGNGTARNNLQAHPNLTGQNVYHPSDTIGDIATAGGVWGIFIYAEGGTILPYSDTPGLLRGVKGIRSARFNAWISAGGPLAAGSVVAILVMRGIEVPISSLI